MLSALGVLTLSLAACSSAQPSAAQSAAAADASWPTPAIPEPVRTRLLSIADREAAGCSGRAVHVQAAKSSRETATKITMQEIGQVGDQRPVWALLVTGGSYTCINTGPKGASSPPAKDLLLILDAVTFQTTDGGSPHDTLDGLSPVVSLR